MRTIKFRGKHVHMWKENGKFDGVWVYGYLCSNHNIYDETINADMLVLPSTVGQFTGLYDKNGKEIYEGDIVIGENYLFPCYDNRKLTIEWLEKDCGFDMRIFNMNEIEVIGNIHDNKELLK